MRGVTYNQLSLTLNTTTEVRPLSKEPKPQLLPGCRSIGCPLLWVCVHGECVCVCTLLTAVCVHLDGLNAEHKFQVRATIIGHKSPPFLFPIEYIWSIIKWKICRRPLTLQQLETYIRQQWAQIPTPKLQKLDAQTSSNCFKKKRRCYTIVNMPPSQL